MKKLLLYTLSLFLLTSVLSAAVAMAAPADSATSAILIDSRSGEVLYEHNADEKRNIASTTKILTALVALSRCGCDDVVDIKQEYTGIEGSSMYLKPGEKLTVRELLYGLLMSSGNDAAVALACHTAGTIDQFAKMMNDQAAALGCRNSNFKNPNGLDEEGHYSTARDLAKITACAMKSEVFCEIVSTKTAVVAGRSLVNHNKLLWDYTGAVGVKTGYTKSSGRSLVSCAERDGMRLICVTLSDPNDWDDHAALYDWAFNCYTCVEIKKADSSEVPVISGVSGAVQIHPAEDFYAVARKADSVKVSMELPHFVYAPVRAGDTAGYATVVKNGEPMARIPLVYAAGVELDKNIPLTRWEKMKRIWYNADESMNRYGYYRYGYVC